MIQTPARTAKPGCSVVPGGIAAPILRFALHSVFHALGGIRAVGAENVPSSGPVILCPNHRSDCDPVAVYVTSPRRDIYFLAKEELFEIRFLGAAMRRFGTFPIRRDSPDRSAIRQAQEVLATGAALVMFPEGRLTQDGRLQPIQPGAAMVALRAQAPIVPIGLAHTERFLPYAEVVPRQSRIAARVSFGAPILPADVEGEKGRAAIDAMTALLDQRLRRLAG